MLISDWPVWGKVLFWLFVWGGAACGGWLAASRVRVHAWLGVGLAVTVWVALIVGAGRW